MRWIVASDQISWNTITAVCSLQIGDSSREDPMKNGFGAAWSTLVLKRVS